MQPRMKMLLAGYCKLLAAPASYSVVTSVAGRSAKRIRDRDRSITIQFAVYLAALFCRQLSEPLGILYPVNFQPTSLFILAFGALIFCHRFRVDFDRFRKASKIGSHLLYSTLSLPRVRDQRCGPVLSSLKLLLGGKSVARYLMGY
jgi:hypothetical protein